MSEPKCGIYAIQCAMSGKMYIGSSVRIHLRWSQHRRELRRGTHNSPRLQRAWIKHGEDSFVFSVLEECSRDALFDREQFHIDRCKPDYNSMLKVRVITKEMREKMNATMRAIAELRTHCPRGHEYTPENVYMGKKAGDKRCKACNRERIAALYASETTEQTAERNRKNMERYRIKYDEIRAKQNEYAAKNREAKNLYDRAYRHIKNARRRMKTIERRTNS